MQGTSSERALDLLGDYLFELETNVRRQHRREKARAAKKSERPQQPVGVERSRQEIDARRWERRRLKVWKRSGRITVDGTLRISTMPASPYTLKIVGKIAPHLSASDRIAALIELDGVVKEGFLESKEHENIREVVERIADRRITTRLQDGEARLMLRDLIREELALVFGEVKTNVDLPLRTMGPSRQKACSKCHVPGHRATTCGRDADANPAPFATTDAPQKA